MIRKQSGETGHQDKWCRSPGVLLLGVWGRRCSRDHFLSITQQYPVYSDDSSRRECPSLQRNSLWKPPPALEVMAKQRQRISRCSHVHCLLPHMGMFSLSLCPCVSRQDGLNYFAQLPPWTLATARQYTHHADARTHSHREHSSCPSHTWILGTYQTWIEKENNKKKKQISTGHVDCFYFVLLRKSVGKS